MQNKQQQQPEKIFLDLKGSDQPTVIESVCTSCFESGETTILLTKIPFFREIMITSFCCDHCGNKNNQVQFAGELPDYGVEILFRVLSAVDLNREIIKSEFAQIKIQELDLEIPENKKAQITTVEGLLLRIQKQLTLNQQYRKIQNNQQYEKIELFLQKLRIYKNGEKFPLTIKISDPSGNSNVKNPYAPKQDKNLQIANVMRSLDDLTKMGYSRENAEQQIQTIHKKRIGTKINFTKPFQESEFMKYQPVTFDVPCHSCQMPGSMKMCQISVPYFTDIVIMSFVCDYCGAHSTETKNSGQVKEEGCIITLKCENDDDLKRDLFKSQTCAVNLPDIELQLDYGTLGGVFTTVEGLLEKIYDHLSERNAFTDSDPQFYETMSALLAKLKAMRQGQIKFTLILNDPLAHSFLQNPNHPNEDTHAKIVFSKRTEEEDEFLGLHDMKTDNYQQHIQTMKKQNHKIEESHNLMAKQQQK